MTQRSGNVCILLADNYAIRAYLGQVKTKLFADYKDHRPEQNRQDLKDPLKIQSQSTSSLIGLR